MDSALPVTQVYVLSKGWRFQAVTILQYTQSRAGSRKQRQRQQPAGGAAASLQSVSDIEAASFKASAVPQDDSSWHSSALDSSLASKPDAEQGAAGPVSQQTRQELSDPDPSTQSAGGSRRGLQQPPGTAASRPATIVPHPGGPGGKWEEVSGFRDSSRSLAASSASSLGKTAVVVPEAARFAALKSATLWRQLVRRCRNWKLHAHTVLPPCWTLMHAACWQHSAWTDPKQSQCCTWLINTTYYCRYRQSASAWGPSSLFPCSCCSCT